MPSFTNGMDAEIKSQLDRIEAKADAAQKAAESTRKMILWTGIITLVLIVLPLFFLPFAIGSLMSNYNAALNF